MPAARKTNTTYERIYAAVRRVPRGRVTTYGDIARFVGIPGHARQVGYALHHLSSATAVPWQRVVNAAGAISLAPARGGINQRILLEREGVKFDAAGRVRLSDYRWAPRRRQKN